MVESINLIGRVDSQHGMIYYVSIINATKKNAKEIEKIKLKRLNSMNKIFNKMGDDCK